MNPIPLYLHCLSAADYDTLMSLFAKDAVVHSPLYGTVPAVQFYKDLFKDTAESNITLLKVYPSEDGRGAAAHFQYDWTLANGTRAPFEVVDLFTFDAHGKITELKIIYDTAKTRPALEALKNKDDKN